MAAESSRAQAHFAALPTGEVLELLASGEVVGIGLHPEGSNYVFVAKLNVGDEQTPLLAIYKPQSGERPLRDFPRGTLYMRECAAYELSAALAWPHIPPTVIRDGPYGIGSMQLFIDADETQNYFTLRDDHIDLFEPIALFDILTNNADRKAGACLSDTRKQIWAIDHGLTFNPYARQRTVMWEFCGEPISDHLVAGLNSIQPQLDPKHRLGRRLAELLADYEVEFLRARIKRLLATPRFPILDPHLNIPWPFV